jgi:hypothetical protein
MEKALFKGIKEFIIGKLNKTEKTLHIAVAWFTNDDLFQVVLGLLDRNIQVELILIDDCINRNEFGLNFGQFIAKGGHLYFSTSHKNMHNKFCVIDEKLVITGSYNWTYYAENRNWENILVSDNYDVINHYSAEFEDIKSHLSETKEYSQYKLDEIDPINLLNGFEYLYEDLQYKTDTDSKKYTNYLSAVIESIAIEKKYSVEVPQKSTKPKALVTRNSLGIRCMIEDKNDCFSVMIPKGTEIPYEVTREFFTSSDYQVSLPCETLIGESPNANENLSIGKIRLNDYPPLPKGQGQMNVTFKITTDKQLHVVALNLITKSSVSASYPLEGYLI